MTLANDLSTQFKARILPALPEPLRALILGGTRRHLLAKVNQRFLVFNQSLINLDSGEQTTIDSAECDDWAAAIALAASKLVTGDEPKAILLYLPPSEFVATTVNMPGLDRDMLLSALALQTDNLFPSFNKKLVSALGGENPEPDTATIALWLPETRMDQLFEAFSKQGLFLVSIAPRVIIDSSSKALVDVDASGGTLVEFQAGQLSNWISISQLDINDGTLNQEWTASIAATGTDKKTLDSCESYANLGSTNHTQDYMFFPSGALAVRKQEEKGRNRTFAAAAVIAALVVAAIPFLYQSFQFRSLASTLAEYREQSATARENQLIVVNFENQWGAITDFPEQDIPSAMFTLQNILLPDQLASLELNQGLLKIQGSSSEPQAILQRLEQDPMFTEVAFSRATNNSRYYIDLRLSTVNFEGYMVRYFPDE